MGFLCIYVRQTTEECCVSTIQQYNNNTDLVHSAAQVFTFLSFTLCTYGSAGLLLVMECSYHCFFVLFFFLRNFSKWFQCFFWHRWSVLYKRRWIYHGGRENDRFGWQLSRHAASRLDVAHWWRTVWCSVSRLWHQLSQPRTEFYNLR